LAFNSRTVLQHDSPAPTEKQPGCRVPAPLATCPKARSQASPGFQSGRHSDNRPRLIQRERRTVPPRQNRSVQGPMTTGRRPIRHTAAGLPTSVRNTLPVVSQASSPSNPPFEFHPVTCHLPAEISTIQGRTPAPGCPQ
jgi:hypothetical protein